jgi:general secretion pathway protein D
MQNPKRLIPLRGRAALLASACLLSPLLAGETGKPAAMAAAKLSHSVAGADEAQELLQKGDESYNAGRYAEAVQAYAGARESLPDSAEFSELRTAATDRYAQASVEYGRDLARKGDVAGAKAAVDKVLAANVAPQDPGARAFRAQLDDPIRTNPALDIAHAKKVDQVRQLLYTAEGAYDLGAYDKAKSTYEQVLRLDPYNVAARRGMEKVSSTKGEYQKSAYDHSRAELLSQVDGAWETQLSPLPIDPNLPAPGLDQAAPAFIPVANKLTRIIIPKINLEQSSLAEAVDFLRLKVAEVQGDLGGVNFAIELGDSEKAAEINAQRFDLRLSNTPLAGVLKYLTEITRTSFTTDEYSVIIRPVGSSSDSIVTRTYKVTPDFVSGLSSNAPAGDAAAADPFAAPAPSGGGLLAKRLGAQEALALQGVTFPAGASASFNPTNNTLRVANTEANQDIISQIVETTVQGEPVMVAVRVTMIRTEQSNLEELGFDWLLDNVGFGGSSGFSGIDKLNLSGGTQGNGGNLSDVNPDAAGALGAITAGALDGIIGQGSDRGARSQDRAPGIFKVNGLINGTSVTALMRGLSQKKGVDMMTQPSTVTRSGQASSIHVVREFIYPTEYEPPELPQTIQSTEIYVNGVYVGSQGGDSFPVTPATPTAFKKRDVGVILEVLPTADASKRYVDITLNPSVTDFDGFVNYGSPINAPVSAGPLGGKAGVEVTPNDILMPVFSVQRANTSLTVADGSTIVIGGLLKESVQNVEDKTPVLGSIPVVGRLFQSKARQPVSTAIVFLVNVELLDPTGRPYRNR